MSVCTVTRLFLADNYKSQWSEIQSLSKSESPDAFERLKKYVLEACRLAPPAFGLLRLVGVDTTTIQDGLDTIVFKKADQIFVNFVCSSTFAILGLKLGWPCLGVRKYGPSEVPQPYRFQARLARGLVSLLRVWSTCLSRASACAHVYGKPTAPIWEA